MKKEVILSIDEFYSLLSILNEVCHGIYLYNFESVVGVQKKIVVDWLNKNLKREKEETVILELDDIELNFLQKSFEEVLKQIEEWEFQTRVGITVHEANMLKKKILC